MGDELKSVLLNDWEIFELSRYSEAGEDFPNYDEEEKERWRTLSRKLLKALKEDNSNG